MDYFLRKFALSGGGAMGGAGFGVGGIGLVYPPTHSRHFWCQVPDNFKGKLAGWAGAGTQTDPQGVCLLSSTAQGPLGLVKTSLAIGGGGLP